MAAVQEYSLHFELLFSTVQSVDKNGTDFTQNNFEKWMGENWVRLAQGWLENGWFQTFIHYWSFCTARRQNSLRTKVWNQPIYLVLANKNVL